MKQFKTFLTIAVVSLSFAFVSCGDDNDDPAPAQAQDPGDENKGNGMSPEKQKEYLESVASEFLNYMDAGSFQTYADFGRSVSETYGDGRYDWSNVEEWSKNVFKNCRTFLYDKEDYSSWTIKNTTYYKALLSAAQFKGRFYTWENVWYCDTTVNNLQFEFNQNGQECVLSLSTSGNTKNVHAFNFHERTGSYYDDNWIEHRDYDDYDCTIAVPEHIVLRLTRGGSEMLKTTVNISLGSLTNEEFDFSKDNLTVSTVTTLDNGFEVNVSQVAYSGNKSVAVTTSVKKGSTTLVTINVSGNPSNIPGYKLSEIEDLSEKELEKINATKAYAKIDVLGKVQVECAISDIQKIVQYSEEAQDNKRSEETFKKYISMANDLLEAYVFYDGKDTKEAQITIEPFTKTDRYGSVRWDSQPVLNFFDGSSYSTFEAFFNEDDFKNVIRQYERLIERYAKMVK